MKTNTSFTKVLSGFFLVLTGLLTVISLTSCSKKIEYEGFQDGNRYVVQINSDFTQVTTSIGKAGGELVTQKGKMFKRMENPNLLIYGCFLSGDKPKESDKEVDFEILYRKENNSYQIQNLTYMNIDLISTNGADQSKSKKEWVATKKNIMGLYASDRGMGGWGGTCELLFGTYIIKDQFLTNGRMMGEYTLSGNEITFYDNGSTLGIGIVSEDSLNFGPNKVTYTKK